MQKPGNGLKMGNWVHKAGNLLDLFLRSDCPLCQRCTNQEVCQYCQRQIQGCQLANFAPSPQDQLPVWAWGSYSGALKRAIAALKYENHPQLACPLGYWLAQAWLDASSSTQHPLKSAITVVPIPLHPLKQQQRGYNQAELLAQSFCRVTGLPWQREGLKRVRLTEAQFGLSPTKREENLAEAFQVGTNLAQRCSTGSVLLLDDIYTTGATARAAAQILQQQGISVCGLAAIARPQKTLSQN